MKNGATHLGFLVSCAKSRRFVDPRFLLLSEILQLLLQLRVPVSIPLLCGRSTGFVGAQFRFEGGNLRTVISQLVVLANNDSLSRLKEETTHQALSFDLCVPREYAFVIKPPHMLDVLP